MKAVLISIKPQWCELIANGEKTIEVRKTRPKLDVPFKCYIYETKGKGYEYGLTIADICKRPKVVKIGGKVIGEFVCDKVYDIKAYEEFYGTHYGWNFDFALSDTCLSKKEFEEYLSRKSEHYLKPLSGYGLHISDLKIYDKPKELGEFFTSCKTYDSNDDEKCWGCPNLRVTEGNKEAWQGDCISRYKPLTRPPQSLCYVEELNNV